MDSDHENLLETFEKFQVEEILAEVNKEWVLADEDICEFGEELLEERRRRRQEAQAAQAAQTAYVRAHWNPGCYPQLNTEWFIQGLDFCWTNWHHKFKRPLTPPPAPPPSPHVNRRPRRSHCRRPPVKYRQNSDDDDDVDADFNDKDYDDDDETTELLTKDERRRRWRNAVKKARYLAKYPEKAREKKARYRKKYPERVLAARKRYREKYPD